jgi:GGDEF domain-containing protein
MTRVSGAPPQTLSSNSAPAARAVGQAVSVLTVGLAHFRQLNETFGHDAGDMLLH